MCAAVSRSVPDPRSFGSFSNSLATRTISFPEDELEELLRLVRILQNKIIHIDNSVGLDQIILGDQIHPKVFEIIRRIISKDERLFEELESSAFGGAEKFYQPEGFPATTCDRRARQGSIWSSQGTPNEESQSDMLLLQVRRGLTFLLSV
jgi:hypothetical protein